MMTKADIPENWKVETHANHYVFPDICGLARDVYERAFVPEELSFSGNGLEVGVEGIHLWYQSLEFHQERTWLIENNAARVQMNFNLQGQTACYSDKLGKVFVRFKGGQHNLMLIPEGRMRLQWPAGERTEIFSLSLSEEFFFATLPDEHPLRRHFAKGIDLQLPAFMSLRNLPVTPRMAQVLFEILHCEYEGHYKKLYVQAKTVELLLLQMDQYDHLPLPDFSSRLESEHAEQMHQVKRMLDEHPDRHWSLKDLAHVVGTNEFNLKKYFKEVFGTTVFNYLHEVRMETSRRELCKPGSTIHDVAQRVGYKHATHFTAAFKKFHGVLPTKLRAAL